MGMQFYAFIDTRKLVRSKLAGWFVKKHVLGYISRGKAETGSGMSNNRESKSNAATILQKVFTLKLLGHNVTRREEGEHG